MQLLRQMCYRRATSTEVRSIGKISKKRLMTHYKTSIIYQKPCVECTFCNLMSKMTGSQGQIQQNLHYHLVT